MLAKEFELSLTQSGRADVPIRFDVETSAHQTGAVGMVVALRHFWMRIHAAFPVRQPIIRVPMPSERCLRPP